MPALRCLASGATVGLIAPAGPADPAALAQVPALLAGLGLQPRLFPSCFAQHGHLAGDDDLRLADLHAAFAAPEVAAVWCLRGGFGSGRLLDRIDTALLRSHRKPLIGYSDITALHGLANHLGLHSLHAPMPASDLLKPGREADAQALMDWLFGGLRAGTLLAPALEPGALRGPGQASGRLLGGNLAVLASLLGTPWQLRAEGAVLFLEDVSEPNYRIDRLLLQLRLAGVLDAAAGFLLGSFTEGEDPRSLLAEYLLPLGKPVLGGWPAGHGTPNRPLPLGARVTLDAAAGTLRVDEDVLLPAGAQGL